jgi:exopolysaccharide biosynthesis operon protein EpsL
VRRYTTIRAEKSAGERGRSLGKNHHRLAAALVALIALAPFEAAADVFSMVATASIAHDTNVFKQPLATPDTVKTGSVGLRIDKTYGQQRFRLDGTGSAYRHNANPQLDFDGLDYRAAWQWYLTSRFTGSVHFDRTEGQVPFVDFQRAAQNVRITKNSGVDGDVALGYGVHIIGGASRSEQQSTAVFLAQPDFKLDYIQAGFKYIPSPGSAFSFIKRTGNGLYTKQDFDPTLGLDTAYKQNETQVQVDWLPSNRSNLVFRLNQFERRHRHLSQLDSSGFGGEVTFVWNASGKLSVGLSARRDFVPFFDAQTTHRVDRTLSIAPKWQIDSRFALSVGVNRTQSDFLGNVTTQAGETRQDHYGGVDATLSWAPTRNISLNVGGQRLRRSSNDPLFIFDSTIARLGVNLTF